VNKEKFLDTQKNIHSTVKNKKNISYKKNYLLNIIQNTTNKKKSKTTETKKYITILNNQSHSNNYFHLIKKFIKNKLKIPINATKIKNMYFHVKQKFFSEQKKFFSFIKNNTQCKYNYSQYEKKQNVLYYKIKNIMLQTASHTFNNIFFKHLYKKTIKSKINLVLNKIISSLYNFYYRKISTNINNLYEIEKIKNIYIKYKFEINNLWKQSLKKKLLISQLQKENESNFFFHDKNIGSIHIKIKLKNKDAILIYTPYNLENKKIFFLEFKKLQNIFNNYGLSLRLLNTKNIKYVQKKPINTHISCKQKNLNLTKCVNNNKIISIDTLTYNKKKKSNIVVHFYA